MNVSNTHLARYFFLNLLVCLIFGITGCSFLERNTVGLFSDENKTTVEAGSPDGASATPVAPTEKQPTPPREVPISAYQRPGLGSEKIELTWKIPSEEVDGFVIHYGFDRQKLGSEIQVKVEDLEQYDHPQYGPVYRYYLENLPKTKTAYVAISALKDSYVSNPSEVFEISPGRAR